MGGGREREGEKRGDKGLHTRQVSRTAGTRIATPVGFGALPLSLTRILDLHVFTAFLTNRFRKVRLTYRNSAVQYSVRSVGPAWPTEVRATTRRGPEDHQRSLALCSTIVATQIAGMLYPHASPPGRVPLHTAARAHAQHAQRRDSHRSFLAQIHQILPFLVPECACSTCRRRCATRRGQNRVSIRLRSRLSRLREVPRASCPTRATGYACELVKKRSSEPQTQKRPRLESWRLESYNTVYCLYPSSSIKRTLILRECPLPPPGRRLLNPTGYTVPQWDGVGRCRCRGLGARSHDVRVRSRCSANGRGQGRSQRSGGILALSRGRCGSIYIEGHWL